MANNNPIRAEYLTCSNESRRLVVRASTEYNQSNSYISNFFKIHIRTVQRILSKFHLTEVIDKLPRGGNKPFK
jgi:transposase